MPDGKGKKGKMGTFLPILLVSDGGFGGLPLLWCLVCDLCLVVDGGVVLGLGRSGPFWAVLGRILGLGSCPMDAGSMAYWMGWEAGAE